MSKQKKTDAAEAQGESGQLQEGSGNLSLERRVEDLEKRELKLEEEDVDKISAAVSKKLLNDIVDSPAYKKLLKEAVDASLKDGIKGFATKDAIGEIRKEVGGLASGLGELKDGVNDLVENVNNLVEDAGTAAQDLGYIRSRVDSLYGGFLKLVGYLKGQARAVRDEKEGRYTQVKAIIEGYLEGSEGLVCHPPLNRTVSEIAEAADIDAERDREHILRYLQEIEEGGDFIKNLKGDYKPFRLAVDNS